MRGHDLREILSDIRKALGSAGAPAHVDSLRQTEEAIAALGDLDAREVVARLEQATTELSAPPWQKRLREIEFAGLSEPDFIRAFEALRADRQIKKSDLAKITEAYVGYADKKANAATLLDAIKSRFYGKVYDHDANAMAKRATPW